MKGTKVLRGSIHETDDMSIFKKLEGNRNVSAERVKKIDESADRIGWVMPLIIVNEKMEIIDGQGRVEIARNRGLPVYYQVIPDIGADECISMNIEQTNWTMMDFCKSWAQRGNGNYQRLLQIIDAHDYSFSTIVCAVTGLTSVPAKVIKEGRLICTREQIELADEALTWLDNFKVALDKANGAVGSRFYMALIFIYTVLQGVDLDRLVERICSYKFTDHDSFANVHTTLAFIEERYNSRLSAKSRIYFTHEYAKAQALKLPWYEAKWGWKTAEAL